MTNIDPPLQTAALNIEQTLRQAIEHHHAGRLEEAVALYQSILQADPSHAEGNHNMGVMAVQVGQAAAGLSYFTVALDADPSRAQYWLSYIDALFHAGQFEDARQVLALARQQGLQGEEVDALAMRLEDKAPFAEYATTEELRASKEPAPVPPADPNNSGNSSNPKEIGSLVDLFGQGRFTEAATLARTMTERFPQHEFGWKALGAALKQMGQTEDALAPMQRAVTLSSGDVEAHYNLAVTLQDMGRRDEAEANYREALRINPNYAEAHSNLGVILKKSGQLDEAEASYRRALQINPDYAEALSNLGATLQELGRLDDAEISYRRALQISPNNAETHNNLGNTLTDLGRLDEAEASYRHALQINPDHADAHCNLANALKDLDRLDDAEASYRCALEIKRDYADAHYNLGNVLKELGRLNEAETSYRKALEIKPDSIRVHSNLGVVLQELDRGDKAEDSFRKAIQIEPDFLEAHFNLGIVLKKLGRLDEAEASYRRALEIQPDYAGAHSNLGVVLMSLDRPDEAEACYRRALECNPEKRTIENFLLSVTKLRKFEAGAQFLQSLTVDFPGNGYLVFAAGWLRANAGDFEAAEALLDDAVKLVPALASRGDYSCSKADLPIWLPPYRNQRAREMSDEEWRYAELSEACFTETASLIAKTRIVSIEISNICNYATIHPRCPVHNYKTKEVLPADSIKRILDELGEIGFTGCISWGCYTEPLIDPRLTDLVGYARKVCPRAKNALTTNGFYLTPDSAADLVSAGLDQIFVSAYSMSEYLRLILLPVPASYTVYNSKLEKRTEDNVYTRNPLDYKALCFPFILNLMITCKGDLGLCCFDFERRHTFGNIHTSTLRDLLSDQAVIEAHHRLASGDRSILDACRRCGNGFSSYPYWLSA